MSNAKQTHTPRLVPINPPLRPGQRVQCCKCYRITSSAMADMNGPAFQAYYCQMCQSAIARAEGGQS